MKNKTLEKTFRILECLAEHGEAMSIQDLGRAAEVERSAAWRIVSDLCELGLLRKAGYRHVEPDVGMVFLGQGAACEAFFPRRARLLLERATVRLQVNCALGGLFRNHVVYFFRGGEVPPVHVALYGSNVALCILGHTLGKGRAAGVLRESLDNSELSTEERTARMLRVTENLDYFATHGYAVDEIHGSYNLAFPVSHGNRTYALSFYQLDVSRRDRELPMYIIEAGKLRNELEHQLEPQ